MTEKVIRAICATCGKIQNTRECVRDVNVKDAGVFVKDLRILACVECDDMVGFSNTYSNVRKIQDAIGKNKSEKP